ncbi:MAG: hypothetical protein EOM20_21335 [Spartobacteria bacterium]|nr:hypothetical protein [Spartobacteria bacterium]
MTSEQRALYKEVFAGMDSEAIVEQLEEWNADARALGLEPGPGGNRACKRCDMRQLPMVDELMAATFEVPRDPCSPAYKVGARAGMRSMLEQVQARCPYTLGTAEADAWFAGLAEGRRRVRCLMAEQVESEPSGRQVWSRST